MKKVEIDSIEKFHEVILDYRPIHIFRGVKKERYKLIPRIGRIASLPQSKEKTMLKQFKQIATPHLDIKPQNDLEWLTIAQHHGLPTRLLDWTTSPLIAAYFAVEKPYDGDSAIYVYGAAEQEIIGFTDSGDPFTTRDLSFIYPIHVSKNVAAQSSMFSIHPDPRKAFSSESVHKLIIKKTIREQLKMRLYYYGITRASLFPSLEGICEFIKWVHFRSK